MELDNVLRIQKPEEFEFLYNLLNKNLMIDKNTGNDFALDAWNRSLRQYARHHHERNFKNIGGMEDGF